MHTHIYFRYANNTLTMLLTSEIISVKRSVERFQHSYSIKILDVAWEDSYVYIPVQRIGLKILYEERVSILHYMI